MWLGRSHPHRRNRPAWQRPDWQPRNAFRIPTIRGWSRSARSANGTLSAAADVSSRRARWCCASCSKPIVSISKQFWFRSAWRPWARPWFAAVPRAAAFLSAPDAVIEAVSGFHVHRGILALARRKATPDVTAMLARCHRMPSRWLAWASRTTTTWAASSEMRQRSAQARCCATRHAAIHSTARRSGSRWAGSSRCPSPRGHCGRDRSGTRCRGFHGAGSLAVRRGSAARD